MMGELLLKIKYIFINSCIKELKVKLLILESSDNKVSWSFYLKMVDSFKLLRMILRNQRNSLKFL